MLCYAEFLRLRRKGGGRKKGRKEGKKEGKKGKKERGKEEGGKERRGEERRGGWNIRIRDGGEDENIEREREREVRDGELSVVFCIRFRRG